MKRLISYVLIVLGFSFTFFYFTPGAMAESMSVEETPATSIILRTIDIYLNGEQSPLNYAAFIDTGERAVISLNDCSLIFGAQIEIIDTRLLLRKGSQELLIEKEDYLQLPPAHIENNMQPGLKLDEFYLPMRFVAENLGYEINYNHRVGAIILRSSDYEGPDPDFAPPAPPELPANLPAWGSFAEVPVMAELWPAENIIAGYYTNFAGSSASRINNINLSTTTINGTIVKSGEAFSFNRTVGQRTAAKGYQTAGVIVGKKMVQGIGGGVCQTSTTLYNSALEAGLQILERHPHNLRVSYVPVNRDATVSWGTADMKFKNNQPFDIKILGQVYGNYVVFAIAAVDYQ